MSGSRRAPDAGAVFRAAPREQRASVALLVQLASIDNSPLNPRTHFDDEDLQRLADSLQADGTAAADRRHAIGLSLSLWPANVVLRTAHQLN